MFKTNVKLYQLNITRLRSRGTAAIGAQKSSPPVGVISSVGSSPAPFKPSEPRGMLCSIVMHNKVDVLKQIWLFGSVQISGTVYSEVSYSGRSIVGSIGHSDLSDSL
ncbi:hypothetical protein F511_39745 [Dorcoceras hygrometricum]|uniref:Uncharacterized protein n=1 Tax=Dorcoceras hygrometricum TaxID=472368 RepID=A0A2Z7B2H5_9LAMI|nr:hypothetical protein F511_39745 [Dorcoceras hygrometricum]